ncbi:YdcF family protein [candidate division WOR-3 bacterium]|nr:YdcF family protein [candidate division WOR-3 bacterium]
MVTFRGLAMIILGSKNKDIMKERIKYAESLLEDRKGFKVIFSGSKDEVEWMISHSSLSCIVEDKSETTYDNLLNSIPFLKETKRVWIITDSTHHFRTGYLARKIFRDIPFCVLSIRMPLLYHIRQLYYEGTRFIHNAFL